MKEKDGGAAVNMSALKCPEITKVEEVEVGGGATKKRGNQFMFELAQLLDVTVMKGNSG